MWGGRIVPPQPTVDDQTSVVSLQFGEQEITLCRRLYSTERMRSAAQKLQYKQLNVNHMMKLQDNLSRRDFLSRLGITGAGLAALATAADAAPGLTDNGDANKAGAVNMHGHGAARGQHPVQPRSGGQVEARIHINQAGYLPGEPKRAVVAATDEIASRSFCLVDDNVTRRVHYRGELKAYRSTHDSASGRDTQYYYADFDGFTTPGRYQLRLADGRMSAPFSIRKDIYAQLLPLTLEFFAVQRCGGGDNDPAREVTAVSNDCDRDDCDRDDCHRDDGVARGGPRDGKPFDASGGWHDAGDYLKFVETTSYVTAMMLFAADHFPALVAPRPAALGLPPLLAHARVGLEWLLKMHPTPGEFYYQVGDARDHDKWRLPQRDCARYSQDWQSRPVRFGVGANLAGRTAAAFALGFRLYGHHDPAFAARCLSAAASVYELGLTHRDIVTTEPRDFYPESTWEDDMAWGAATLYRVTNDPKYLQQALEFAHRAGAANEATSVYNTHALAHATLYPYAPEGDRERLREYLRTDADLARQRAGNPYGLATPYVWGTAEAAAGAALNCLLYAHCNEIGSNDDYLEVARHNRDFILGCNPFGISYLIGAGTHYPLFPHHQMANLKQIELRGALVGGPTAPDVFQHEKIVFTETQGGMVPGPMPAEDLADEVAVYHDAVQDYVTNEPAIDYTVKFLLLAAFYYKA
jgi:endoglucanase